MPVGQVLALMDQQIRAGRRHPCERRQIARHQLDAVGHEQGPFLIIAALARLGVEQIIQKLREAELEIAQGQTVAQACKKIGLTEQSYYRWRKEYGGLRTDQAKRYKELEQENARLKRLLAEAELDKAILREAASGNF